MRNAPALAGLLGLSVAAACASQPATRMGSAPATSPADLPGLVSTEQLVDWQRERRVNLIDVRPDWFTYLKGHLPGAVYLNTETLRASEGGIPAQLLSSSAYSELFSRLGLSFDIPAVIYSAGETGNIDATFLGGCWPALATRGCL